MIKKSLLLFLVLLVFPIVSASLCHTTDIRLASLNLESMKTVIEGDREQIREVLIYVDGEEKLKKIDENFEATMVLESLYEPLFLGKEIRMDLVLKDGTLCRGKEVIRMNPNCGNGTLAEEARIGCSPSKIAQLERDAIALRETDLAARSIQDEDDSLSLIDERIVLSPEKSEEDTCLEGDVNCNSTSLTNERGIFRWFLALFRS